MLVDFSYDEIDADEHKNWMKAVNKNLDPQPYWGFDDLFYKAGTKLSNCFFVHALSKKINGELHFHYQDIYMLKKLDMEKFINAIEVGDIYIDFDARTGHNHGTKFRLKRESMIKLYKEVKQY